MRVGFVVQRYGHEVIGGAETHARVIAERLVADCHWQVEVFTTTALDYQTWRHHYPSGRTELAGVGVRRFATRLPRWPWLFKAFNTLAGPLIAALSAYRGPAAWLSRTCGRGLEHLWFILQGPYCPALLQALASEAASLDKIFFFTYLYYPTAFGVPTFAAKAVLVPTAHDEPPLYFPRCRQLFNLARVQLVNSAAEGALLQPLRTPEAPAPLVLQAGLGIDLPIRRPPVLTGEAREPMPNDGLPTTAPYLLYLGRLAKGKGVPALLADFLAFPASSGELHLVLAGALGDDVTLPAHPRIHYVGIVSEDLKERLLARALAVVNPSPRESLSLIVLEALAVGVPVLVNAHCDVLRAYATATTTVFSYRDQQEFIAELQKVLAPPQGRLQWQADLARSQSWVQHEYSWAKVLAAYQQATQV